MLNKLPIWAATLFLAGATVAYGQATQAPAPGGHIPPVAQPVQPGPPGPGPSPQGGHPTPSSTGH